MRKKIVAAACILSVLSAYTSPLHAAPPYDGLWAKTAKDCDNEDDGPSSPILIDLDNLIRGKDKGPPIIDRYENHCRIDSKSSVGDGMMVKATCFEFWEDLDKGAHGRKATIKLSPGPNDTLRIDGKPYSRCKMTIEDVQQG